MLLRGVHSNYINQFKKNIINQTKFNNMNTSTNYTEQANAFLTATGTTFKAVFFEHGKHFSDDTQSRNIYKIRLKNTKGSYTFKFGQSIANSGVIPTSYDVLACLTKSDPYTFEYFCSEFGYDSDSRKSEKTYKAVVKEWQNICRLFTESEIEQLQEIQ